MDTIYTQMYGLQHTVVAEAAEIIAALLGIAWTSEYNPHSEYYYHYGSSPEENFLLRGNYDYMIHEIPYAEYKDYSVLLSVNATRRPEELRALLTEAEGLRDQITLLEQREWELE